jgi:hypothetical protein
MLKRSRVVNLNRKENMTTRDIYSYSNISYESVESVILSHKKTGNKIKIKSTIKEGKILFLNCSLKTIIIRF